MQIDNSDYRTFSQLIVRSLKNVYRFFAKNPALSGACLILLSALTFYFFSYLPIRTAIKAARDTAVDTAVGKTVTKSVLDEAKERGHINCGVNSDLKFFSERVDDYNYKGFDADYCRVIAMALFGDINERVRFHDSDTIQRFTFLNNGIVDVVVRNTTATIGRELEHNITFGPTIFYDTPGILVPVDDSISLVADRNGAEANSEAEVNSEEDIRYLIGKTICVDPGTTTSNNIVNWAANITNVTVKTKDKHGNDIIAGDATDYLNDNSGVCQAFASDRSQLMGRIASARAEYRILDINIDGKEPLSPIYKGGDLKWARLVNYAVQATIYAAEIGISKNDLKKLSTSRINDEDVGIFEPTDLITRDICLIASELKIDQHFVFSIIKEIGNYNDIYDNNIPKDTVNIDRGHNQIYNKMPTKNEKINEKSHLLYSMPFSHDKSNVSSDKCNNLLVWNSMGKS